MGVKVYSTPTCPWCTKVKDFLKQMNVAYEEVDVSANREAAMEMVVARRDILDAAVYALEGAALRREMSNICSSGGPFPQGAIPFCSRCGELHHNLK